MHGIWKFLLDEDFIHAYKYGMVVKCVDGIKRWISLILYIFWRLSWEVNFFLLCFKWILDLILLIESCLPIYKTRVFTLALNASLQNQDLMRQAWSMTVNFSSKMFTHTCLTLFKLPRMQSMSWEQPLLMRLSTDFSNLLLQSQQW